MTEKNENIRQILCLLKCLCKTETLYSLTVFMSGYILAILSNLIKIIYSILNKMLRIVINIIYTELELLKIVQVLNTFIYLLLKRSMVEHLFGSLGA